jgi:hypothetical protein
MRLKWLDRIRRLAHLGRPAGAAGSAEAPSSQGKHRKKGRRGSGYGPSSAADEWSAPGQDRPPHGPGGAGPGGADPGAGSRPAFGWPSAEESRQAVGYALPPAPGAAVLDPAMRPENPAQPMPGGGAREGRGVLRGSGQPAMRAGAARARVREAPVDSDAIGVPGAARPPVQAASRSRQHWLEDAAPAAAHAAAAGAADIEVAGVVTGVPRQSIGRVRPPWRARLPFAPPHAIQRPLTADGRRNCGSLEGILWRQWDAAAAPPAEVVAAIDRLAELPEKIKQSLAYGLDAIFVGPGGVPELDEMTGLRGVPLPSGRASWDACAGAYGERKIVVGSQPSPTPDVMCHEVGHALDDLDSPPGKWQSDSAEFRMLYEQCQSHLASDFHLQPGGLGRKEFFADAFAAIASRQRPALVDMLGGDTRTALTVMLYFNRRYGI